MPSVNKSKLLEAAQKQIAKGHLDKALKEYQKILRADSNDTGVRLKAGELCERMGDRSQALAEYRRVASTFTSQGFYSKAVAVLKRIQSADPNQVEIHLELAELNEKLGLLSEVVHHYQLAANAYDRKGEKRAAIDVLKKVSEVGQSNLERKVKVAELYYKEGFPEAGYEQFLHATADLEEQSPELLEVAIRMCKASPDDPHLIERLGAIYLGQGEPKLAIEALERAREIADEPSTFDLLAHAKLQEELPGEARILFEKAAELYEDRGDKKKARDTSARATELAEQALDGAGHVLESGREAGQEAGQEAGLPPDTEAAAGEAPADGELETEDSIAQPPESGEAAEEEGAPASGEAASASDAREDVAETAGGYEVNLQEAPASSDATEEDDDDDLSEDERLEVAFSEAEVYRKYGKMEGAARVLEGVAKRFPSRHEPRIRLKELYEATGNWARVADQCRMLGLIASARGDDLRSSRFLDEAKKALGRLVGEQAGEEAVGEAERSEPAPEAGSAGVEDGGPDGSQEALPSGPSESETQDSLDIRIDEEGLGDEMAGPQAPAQEAPPEEDSQGDPLAAIEDQLIRPDAFQEGSPPGAPDDGLLDLELVIDDEGANPEGKPLSEEGGGGSDEASILPPGDSAMDVDAAPELPDGPAAPFEEADIEPAAALEGKTDEESATGIGAEPGFESGAPPDSESAAGSPLDVDADEAIATGGESAVEGVEDDVDLKAAELLASQGKIDEAASLYARAVEASPEDETVRARYESLLARLEPGDEEDGGPGTPAVDPTQTPGIEIEGTNDDTGDDTGEDARDDLGDDLGDDLPDDTRDDLREDMREDMGDLQAGEDDGSDAVVLLDEIADEDPSWDWASSDGRLSTSNELGQSPSGSPPPEEKADAAPPGQASPGAEQPDQSAFDLRAVLEQDPDAPDAIGDVSDATEALSDLVTELQKEEQETAASLDAQTHYDLGVAYKEMGLLDEAVRELSIAVNDADRRVECCEVLGVCYREQGRPEEAVRMLEECLGDGSIAAESAPGLLYEMAMAQEAMGNLGKALDWYERVHQIDPHFSDAGARMASLRGGEEVEGPAAGQDNPLEGEGMDEIEEMLDDLESDS